MQGSSDRREADDCELVSGEEAEEEDRLQQRGGHRAGPGGTAVFSRHRCQIQRSRSSRRRQKRETQVRSKFQSNFFLAVDRDLFSFRDKITFFYFTNFIIETIFTNITFQEVDDRGNRAPSESDRQQGLSSASHPLHLFLLLSPFPLFFSYIVSPSDHSFIILFYHLQFHFHFCYGLIVEFHPKFSIIFIVSCWLD